MKIIYLPLEPFEQRYTEDWYYQYPREFKKFGIDYLVCDGVKLMDEIETGRFLDVHNTIYWKNSQMAKFAKMVLEGSVSDGDVVFDADLWHPSLESLAYIRDLGKINFRIVGVLHAGLWDKWDFLSQTNVKTWGRFFEEGWLNFVDMVFVATEFHKELISMYFKDEKIISKIKVTGLPFFAEELQANYLHDFNREYDIVFPHRLDIEKQPDCFSKMFDGKKSIRTMDYYGTPGCDKNWYYGVLSGSKVAISFALQETFGYCMLEATALGATPLVPDRLSYKEMYPSEYRFSSLSEAEEKANFFMLEPAPCPQLTYKYKNAIERMLICLG